MMDIYQGKRAMVLGNTGFTGTWLCLLLHELGCRVYGYTRGISKQNGFCKVAHDYSVTTQYYGDITDRNALKQAINGCAPDIIFHLAGQPLIGVSDKYPAETINVNAIGTLCVLDTVSEQNMACKVIVITSDKCYKAAAVEDKDKVYEETDEIGGGHIYMISKVVQEQFVQLYYNKFRDLGNLARCCTVRPGNIIGGGDFSHSRLVPDIVNAIRKGDKILLRDPDDVRPWTYILDAIYAYLLVGEGLFKQDRFSGSAFNVGPAEKPVLTTREIAEFILNIFGAPNTFVIDHNNLQRIPPVFLSTRKMHEELNWRCNIAFDEALRRTANWYKMYFSNKEQILNYTVDEINQYLKLA